MAPDAPERVALPGEKTCSPRRPTWEWRPRSCALLDDTDSGAACSAIGGGVVLIGDSIAEQHWQELAGQLSAEIDTFHASERGPCSQIAVGARKNCKQAIACDGRAFIALARTDYLWAGTATSPSDVKAERNSSWWAEPGFLRAFDVVVVNTGAHGAPTFNASVRVAPAAAALLRMAHPRAMLLFRETHPGAGACSEHERDAPLPDAEAALAHVRSHPGSRNFGWTHILRNNVFVAASLRPLRRFRWLPVGRMSAQRWDARVGWYLKPSSNSSYLDCLHWCTQTGPLRDWNRMLLHVVRMERGHGVDANHSLVDFRPWPHRERRHR